MDSTYDQIRAPATPAARSRRYLALLVVLMGGVAVMDQYLSTVKLTALPYILEEYSLEAAQFSALESLYLAVTFLVFVLNGLNDIIGRKWSILVLVLLMGLSALGIVLATPTLSLFMIFYTLATFTTVSNMWTIPIGEEAPAARRARLVSIVYVIGLIPLQAILPPLIVDTLGLDWKWMYGVMAVFMIPILVLWLFMKETRRYAVVKEERAHGSRKRHFFGLGVIDRRDGWYIFVSASIWICWLVNSLLYYWAGYFFMTVKGYTLGQWSAVLLVTLIMAMLGGVAGGWLMDRLGRKTVLIAGCLGLAVTLSLLAVLPRGLLPVAAAGSGFFTSFAYSWIVVYVPEVFPTERRGACMGWTTTVARAAYVLGPALAAVLLRAFPTMDWYWIIAGAIMLIPIGIVLVLKPYETRVQQLEEIEVRR
jgi:MFS family permease